MANDRILEPAQIAGIIRDYLGGALEGRDAALRALRLAASDDRIMAGHQTRAVVTAYWELRRLAETGPFRPDQERLQFLLDCIEGRRRLPPEQWTELVEARVQREPA